MTLKSSRNIRTRTVTLTTQAFETQSEAAAFLAISPRTLSRRLETAEFEMGERLKLEMLGSVLELALKTPLQLLDSVPGYERVKSELIGHVYGMF